MSNAVSPPDLPGARTILEETDWQGLEDLHDADGLQAALRGLLDPDPAVQAAALAGVGAAYDCNGAVLPATVPTARYLAAILPAPGTAVVLDLPGYEGSRRWRSLRAELLALLGEYFFTAYGFWAVGDLEGELRELSPQVYPAVAGFLQDGDHTVRDAAACAAFSLAGHPALAHRRPELAAHARRLLTGSTDPYQRERALDALLAWGHDVTGLATEDDLEARRAREAEPPF
ncbi:hypothetical protein ACWEQL_25555 [Kitasatospora sp. NPDC004240]